MIPTVLYFFLGVLALVLGYVIYSRVVARMFGENPERETPAITMADGVDYIKMPTFKVFLIQLLNIAGMGPIFGALLGVLYGPIAIVWIVIGSIFAGGVHDYYSGMISIRYHGKSMPDIVGHIMGDSFKKFMLLFTMLLLPIVGAVFVSAPASLLASLTPEYFDLKFWAIVIFIYYFLATVMPIDAIIGRIYPFFGLIFLLMALGVTGGLIFGDYHFYNWAAWENQHPKDLPIWPLMFVTIACGAVSGFHATQSPMMARCISNEKRGRPVFFGAMIAEGIIALIWATAGMTFYQSPEALQAAFDASGGSPSAAVKDICMTLLGGFGGVIAMIGVIVLPITSGDTALRAARLIVADFFHIPQKNIMPRLLIAIPIFAVSGILTLVNFDIIWRYFGWANQVLAVFVLWTCAAYMVRKGTPHWFASIPAVFMTGVVITYILNAKIGFGLSYELSLYLGGGLSLLALALFLTRLAWFKNNIPLELPLAVSNKVPEAS